MLFGQDRDQLRAFYCQTWENHRQGKPLEPLQLQIVAVIEQHPEYQPLLEHPERALGREYLPESGQTNPFLHMGMHLAIREQVSTDRPPGVRELYRQLLARYVDAPVDGRFTEFDITEEMRKACESLMPAIIETVIDLIADFDPEYQEKVRQNIIVAGGGSQISGLDTYLTAAMKKFEPCKFTCIDDALHAGADGALELATDMPEEFLEKL